MTGWNIVYFKNENSVEAVPRNWMRKYTCAWPKNSKHAKRYIEKQIKPNSEDFFFYPARQLGNKTYDSLTEAQLKLNRATHKSDLSSTEDDAISIRSKKRVQFKSMSLDRCKKVKCLKNKETSPISESCPPRYTQVKDPSFSNINYLAKNSPNDLNSSICDDDIDKYPTWNDKQKMDLSEKQSEDELHDKFLISPSMNENQLIETNNVVYKINSPVGTWSVEKTNMIFDNDISPSKDSVAVKRKLFHEANDTQKSVHILAKEVRHHKNNILDNQCIDMSSKDFQNYVISTLNHMKYDISSLINVNMINRTNIETLMEHANKSSKMVPIFENNYDIEEFLPITNDNELAAIENKIKDPDFRSSLMNKLSLMVGHKDLGNSIRRIMARVFDDHYLIKYSLYGFKKKLPFTKLFIYRVIVDSLRAHIKYKSSSEKDIDVPLGTWLSHAPFRVKNKKKIETTLPTL